MAVVDTDFLAGVLTNFRALFQEDFEAALAFQSWLDIAMKVDSSGRIESYNWFGTPPKLEDVTHGEPTLHGLNNFNFSIENHLFKSIIEVDRSTLEDDKLGLIMPRVRQLGPEAARYPGELIFNLFESGGLAYDGVAFFANTRAIGESANIDNIVGGAYGDGTVAEFQAGLRDGIEAMMLFQDDRGRPMGLTPNVIVVPARLRQTAFQALNANQGTITQPVIPATQSGVFEAAGYKVMVNPKLTTVDDWYMLHVRGTTRPFVFQERIAPALEGITTPTSESGVIRDKFAYSVRARGNVGYGDPRYAVKLLDV